MKKRILLAAVLAMALTLLCACAQRVQEMDVRFHLSILDLTKNPFMIRMVRGVYEFMAREMILKNPNSGEFYESSKKSHVRDLQYLITKGRSGLDRTESIRLAKIYYQY